MPCKTTNDERQAREGRTNDSMTTNNLNNDLAALGLDFGDSSMENLAADLAADNFKRLYKWEVGTHTLRIFPAVADPNGGEPSWYVKSKVHFFQRADGRTVPVPCAMAYAADRGEQAPCWGCQAVAAMFAAGNDEDAKRSKPKIQYYIAAIVRGEQEKLGLQTIPLSRMLMQVISKSMKAFLDDCDDNERMVFHPLTGRDFRIEKSNDPNNPWSCTLSRRATPMVPAHAGKSREEFLELMQGLVQARHDLNLPAIAEPMTESEIIQMMQGADVSSSGQSRNALPAAKGPRTIEAQVRGANSRTTPPDEGSEYYGDEDDGDEGDPNIPF